MPLCFWKKLPKRYCFIKADAQNIYYFDKVTAQSCCISIWEATFNKELMASLSRREVFLLGIIVGYYKK